MNDGVELDGLSALLEVFWWNTFAGNQMKLKHKNFEIEKLLGLNHSWLSKSIYIDMVRRT